MFLFGGFARIDQLYCVFVYFRCMRHVNESSSGSVVGLHGLPEADFCWESLCLLKLHMFTCKVSKNVYYLRWNWIMSLRCEKGTLFMFSSFFICFNVALQDLGPSDQNYLLFVGVFDF